MMTNLQSWKYTTIHGYKMWSRARKDHNKRVTVSFCPQHELFIVRAYVVPHCKCTDELVTKHTFTTQREAKIFSTSWLKY